jgi:anti-sigma B factor antagonist
VSTDRAAGPYFAITESDVDTVTVVFALAGEVDLYTAPEFKRCLSDAIARGKRRLVIDLTEVGFIDSTALGVLVGAMRRLRPLDGGSIAIVSGAPETTSLFEISGLNRAFALYPTREAALGAVA